MELGEPKHFYRLASLKPDDLTTGITVDPLTMYYALITETSARKWPREFHFGDVRISRADTLKLVGFNCWDIESIDPLLTQEFLCIVENRHASWGVTIKALRKKLTEKIFKNKK